MPSFIVCCLTVFKPVKNGPPYVPDSGVIVIFPKFPKLYGKCGGIISYRNCVQFADPLHPDFLQEVLCFT